MLIAAMTRMMCVVKCVAKCKGFATYAIFALAISKGISVIFYI